MFNQKLQTAEDIEFDIAEELRYETDPCELKLDEMIEAEPEPELFPEDGFALPSFSSVAINQPVKIGGPGKQPPSKKSWG